MTIDLSCPLCNLPLGEGLRTLHASYPDGPSLWGFQTWCPDCNVYLGRIIRGREQKGWQLPYLQLESIIDFVSLEEVNQSGEKLRRYPHHYRRWQEKFVGIHREGDIYARYVGDFYGKTGLALIRKGVVIATFETLLNL